MANVSSIKLPDGNTYDIIDKTSGYITGMTILSYGSSTWAEFLEAYNSNKVVYCRASSNSNPATGAQGRLAFMAYINNATAPTEVEFQYYRSVSSHSDSQQGDQVYIYKLNSSSTWSVTVREAYTKIAVGGDLTKSYSNGALTLSVTLPDTSSFITTETDPVFSASAAAGITSTDITNWNSKSNFSGSYNDLTNKPTIPTVPTNVSAFTNDVGYLTTHQDISGKVDKVTGKGLSTNDYTTAEKNKLSGIEAGAEANIDGTVIYASDSTDVDIGDAYGLVIFSGDTFNNEKQIGVIPLEEGTGGWLNSGLQWTSPEIADIDGLNTALSAKQNTLVSGTNIKTVNGNSILGSGDISISASGTPTAFTVILTVAGWSNGSQTVTANGVTSGNSVIVTPAPTSMDDYVDANVVCTNQGTNSLTFTCENTPESAITVNVLKFDGDFSAYYVGSTAPAASLGSDGDIYLKE